VDHYFTKVVIIHNKELLITFVILIMCLLGKIMEGILCDPFSIFNMYVKGENIEYDNKIKKH
jgi:hypothetical protein